MATYEIKYMGRDMQTTVFSLRRRNLCVARRDPTGVSAMHCESASTRSRTKIIHAQEVCVLQAPTTGASMKQFSNRLRFWGNAYLRMRLRYLFYTRGSPRSFVFECSMRGVFEECAFTYVDSELSRVTRMEIFTHFINSGMRGIWQ